MGHCDIAVMFWGLQIRVQNMLSGAPPAPCKTPSMFPKLIYLPPGGQECGAENKAAAGSAREIDLGESAKHPRVL